MLKKIEKKNLGRKPSLKIKWDKDIFIYAEDWEALKKEVEKLKELTQKIKEKEVGKEK